MTTRLATGIWVAAYLQRLSLEGIYSHVVHRGDDTAGAVAVKLALMNGRATLFTRNYRTDGSLGWDPLLEAAAEAEVDAAIARRRDRDRDLWVVEVEDPHGRHMLDGSGFEE